MSNTYGMIREEILSAFIKQYYSHVEDLPKKLILQENIEDEKVIAEWLTRRKGSKVILHVPQRGEKLKLVQMVARNAAILLEEEELAQRKKKMSEEQAVFQLQKILGLEKPPLRIECFDISNTGGSETVGSMAVFVGGKPKRSDYRRFKIKSVKGPDDYASLQEVLFRRFKNAQKNTEGFSALPDMVLIDGGKGQLSAVSKVMKILKITDMPVFSIAKKEEVLYAPDRAEGIKLEGDNEALQLLQRIRDEAHRFAVTYHRHLRGKKITGSVLDEIPGIGPKRKKALLKKFGSVKKISEASFEELAAVDNMNKKTAKKIWEYFNN